MNSTKVVLFEPISRGLLFLGTSLRSLLDQVLLFFFSSAKEALNMTLTSFATLATEVITFQEEVKKQASSFKSRLQGLIVLYISIYLFIWVIGLFWPRLSTLCQILFCLYVAYQIGLINTVLFTT